MIKRLKQLLTTLSIGALISVQMMPLAVVHADDINNNLCNGANLTLDPNATCTSNGAEAQARVNDIIKLVINIFSIIVGVVAVIMIIIGGLKYITSGGDSGNITGAKNTILYAIIGLVVVALAQVVVKFVLAKAAGTTGP